MSSSMPPAWHAQLGAELGRLVRPRARRGRPRAGRHGDDLVAALARPGDEVGVGRERRAGSPASSSPTLSTNSTGRSVTSASSRKSGSSSASRATARRDGRSQRLEQAPFEDGHLALRLASPARAALADLSRRRSTMSRSLSTSSVSTSSTSAQRVDVSRARRHVRVFEGAHHVDDGVDGADGGQEARCPGPRRGSAPSASPGMSTTSIVACTVARRLQDLVEPVEALVGHGHDADVGLGRACRRTRSPAAPACVSALNSGRLADVGQSDDADLHGVTHLHQGDVRTAPGRRRQADRPAGTSASSGRAGRRGVKQSTATSATNAGLQAG